MAAQIDWRDQRCPDCSTRLEYLCEIPGKLRAFVCPIAMEAQRRGLLGAPGRKHRIVQVWEERTDEWQLK